MTRTDKRLDHIAMLGFIAVAFAAVLSLAECAGPDPAYAQNIQPRVGCKSVHDVSKMLFDRFRERLIWLGLSNKSGKIISVYLDEGDGSWTIVVTNPNNCSYMDDEGKRGYAVGPGKRL